MSIFKETLPKYIIDQLTIREAIVKRGNNVSSNSMDPRTSKSRVELKGSGKKVDIDSNAFFTNAISKQCVLRMSSGVDINPGTFPEFPNENNMPGVDLAKKYVLEGGISSEIKNGVVTPREGFARGKGSAYGDRELRSAAKDGFGIVPMPGIIDANVRTKTAYGSLREAKINFVCHNKDQLEILELLYMRPGYPVLLEWGWLPYINNDGKRENSFPYMKEWWEKNSTMDLINESILDKKERSGGNYDAMNGVIKNFEINAREDGGYDCSCELISLGEVLEGLKSKTSKNNDIGYRSGSTKAPIDTFLYYLAVLRQISSGENIPEEHLPAIEQIIEEIIIPKQEDKTEEQKETEESEINSESNSSTTDSSDEDYNARADVAAIAAARGIDIDDPAGVGGGIDSAPNQSGTAGGYDQQAVNEEANTEALKFDPRTTPKGYDIDKIFSPFIVRSSDYIYPLEIPTGFSGGGASFQGVTWDLIVEIFNYFIVPKIKNSLGARNVERKSPSGENVNIREKKFESLVNYTYYEKNTNKYLTFSKLLFPVGFKVSTKDFNKQDINASVLLGSSLDKSVCLLPHQFSRINSYGLSTKKFNEGLLGVSEAVISDYSIGKIFFNINHLINTYLSMFYDKEGVTGEFNFLDYFKKLWQQDVNDACANQHNFIVNVDPQRNNEIRVIDYDVQTLDVQIPTGIGPNGVKPAQFSGIRAKDVYEFKIQSNESVVREFNFNTSIPSNLASIISIAAQAPDDVSSLDEISFSAFNQNITSRFTITESNNTISDLKKIFDDDLDKLRRNLRDLLAYLGNMYLDDSYQDDGDSDKKSPSLAGAKDITRRMNSLIFKVTSKDYKNKTYKLIKTNTYSKSAVIPLRFNARIDGLGGIVIGNVFKVDKTRLPKGYQRSDIAFIVTTEQQNITSGQDWTTDITGQLVLLDLERERVELDGEEVDDISLNISILSPEQREIIENLNITPGVQEKFEEFVLQIQDTTDYVVLITNGYRSVEKQVELVNNFQETGKDPRPAIPGKSLHQYGLAIDINLRGSDGKLISTESSDEEWRETGVVDIANRLGLRWGGNFKNNDDPIHFDLAKVGQYDHDKDKDLLIPFAASQKISRLVKNIESLDQVSRSFKRDMKRVEGNEVNFNEFDRVSITEDIKNSTDPIYTNKSTNSDHNLYLGPKI